MTRQIVYGSAMVAFLAASAMTLAAIAMPQWVSWDSTTSAGTHIHQKYGLHKLCSSLTGTCHTFPQDEDCHGSSRYFCSMWRSVGFLMSFAVVLEGMTFVALVVLMSGGRLKRESGWKVLSFLLVLGGIVQLASVAIIAYLFDNDDRFFVGWRLDSSWILCTVSWVILVLSAAGVIVSAYILPPEGGYELIRDRYDQS